MIVTNPQWLTNASNFNQSKLIRNALGLSPDEFNWLQNNPYVTSEIYTYIGNNLLTDDEQQAIDFANEFIDYAIISPNTTIEKYKNWFKGEKEGQESISSISLENLNLTFPNQSLPPFDDFLLAYPSHLDTNFATSEQVYNSVGGAVLTKFNQGARNTCALRVSVGLNYSGITIPYINGVTVKGADNKNYFLMARDLLSWMKNTFGIPIGSNHIMGIQGGINGINFPNLLQDKQGIYMMVPSDPSPQGFEASGHVDLFLMENVMDRVILMQQVG